MQRRSLTNAQLGRRIRGVLASIPAPAPTPPTPPAGAASRAYFFQGYVTPLWANKNLSPQFVRDQAVTWSFFGPNSAPAIVTAAGNGILLTNTYAAESVTAVNPVFCGLDENAGPTDFIIRAYPAAPVSVRIELWKLAPTTTIYTYDGTTFTGGTTSFQLSTTEGTLTVQALNLTQANARPSSERMQNLQVILRKGGTATAITLPNGGIQGVNIARSYQFTTADGTPTAIETGDTVTLLDTSAYTQVDMNTLSDDLYRFVSFPFINIAFHTNHTFLPTS